MKCSLTCGEDALVYGHHLALGGACRDGHVVGVCGLQPLQVHAGLGDVLAQHRCVVLQPHHDGLEVRDAGVPGVGPVQAQAVRGHVGHVQFPYVRVCGGGDDRVNTVINTTAESLNESHTHTQSHKHKH